MVLKFYNFGCNGLVEKRLRLITLTVNNVCNMSCPHCYLQYGVDDTWLLPFVRDKILSSDFDRLVVVGKEPLFSKDHILNLSSFFKDIKSLPGNRVVSFITNGKNLDLVDNGLLDYVDFFDVSMDGGPVSYERFRLSSYDGLKRRLRRVYYDLGFKNINVLHTIHSGNIGFIDDMMRVMDIIPFNGVLFSPFTDAEHLGVNRVNRLSLRDIFKALSESDLFMKADNAFINVDIFHLEQNRMAPFELFNLAKEFGLVDKLVFHYVDLLPFGVVRITYDGVVMTPRQSLSPKYYGNFLKLSDFGNVNEAWHFLSSRFLKEISSKSKEELNALFKKGGPIASL